MHLRCCIFTKFLTDSLLPFVLVYKLANARQVLLVLFDPICLSHGFHLISDMLLVLVSAQIQMTF